MSFLFTINYIYNKTLKNVTTMTKTKTKHTILTTFSFIFIHLSIHYKINVGKSKIIFFITKDIQ